MSRPETAHPELARLAVSPEMTPASIADQVHAWILRNVPEPWRRAADRGGAAAIRHVRSRADYEAWYPVFAASGLVVPNWPLEYGGLDLDRRQAQAAESELQPYNLGRLNPLGLNLAAPALFSYGTPGQRRRYLPPIVANQEIWCQLFSEPGAGSDLASLATRAELRDDAWCITGQKVWSTWAHLADFGVLLARTDPDVPKRRGLTYFVVDLHAPGVTVRPLRHLTGDHDFNEVFLDQVLVPDDRRIGAPGEGWQVAGATLSGERQMVSGSGSGGVDRIGGSGAERLITLARGLPPGSGDDPVGDAGPPRWGDPLVRQEVIGLVAEERIRSWTNQRVRAGVRAGRSPGPESSIGKVHQGELNQRVQLLATDLLGAAATAWLPVEGEGPATDASGAEPEEGVHEGPPRYARSLPYAVQGMLRSRANTIEGGTTEVNKTIVGERVLGLPREPDPWRETAWHEVPRS